MIKVFFYEDPSGVMLKVAYDPSTTPWAVESVHVLDADYKVCGPDLGAMLDNLVSVDQVLGIGEPFMNLITREIKNGRK